MSETLKIAFDNAGGVTLEIAELEWSRHYQDGERAGSVVNHLLDGGNVIGYKNQWEDGVRVETDEPTSRFASIEIGEDVECLVRELSTNEGRAEAMFKFALTHPGKSLPEIAADAILDVAARKYIKTNIEDPNQYCDSVWGITMSGAELKEFKKWIDMARAEHEDFHGEKAGW